MGLSQKRRCYRNWASSDSYLIGFSYGLMHEHDMRLHWVSLSSFVVLNNRRICDGHSKANLLYTHKCVMYLGKQVMNITNIIIVLAVIPWSLCNFPLYLYLIIMWCSHKQSIIGFTKRIADSYLIWWYWHSFGQWPYKEYCT